MAHSTPQFFGEANFPDTKGNVIWAWMRAPKCLEPLVKCLQPTQEASFRSGHLPHLEVLKRMCRSLYRYPDPEAADVAKKTLEEIRPKTASMEIEVVQNDLHVNEQRIDPWPIPNLIQFVSTPAKAVSHHPKRSFQSTIRWFYVRQRKQGS